jgi:insertion element IS1 protein InsB
MLVREACPGCGSKQYKKNGHIRNGKQNHRCKACGHAFVIQPANKILSEEQRTLIAKLLLEKLSLRGIGRVMGITLKWLLHLMAERFAACPDHLHVQRPRAPTDVVIQRLDAEADEMWSFVGKKANKQWIWIAMDAKTRQIIAFHVGDRSRGSGEQLWAKIPEVYQQQATFYTDLYEVYKGVIPSAQHKAITKKARKTNHVERFNNTLRQRISRLVRETLSFSKQLEHHLGAIKYFICHYNLMRAALPV